MTDEQLFNLFTKRVYEKTSLPIKDRDTEEIFCEIIRTVRDEARNLSMPSDGDIDKWATTIVGENNKPVIWSFMAWLRSKIKPSPILGKTPTIPNISETSYQSPQMPSEYDLDQISTTYFDVATQESQRQAFMMGVRWLSSNMKKQTPMRNE